MLRVFLTWFLAGAGLVLAAFIAASAAFLKSDAEPTGASNAEPTATAVSEAGGVTQTPALVITTAVPEPTGLPSSPAPTPTVAPSPTPAPTGPVIPGRPSGLVAAVEGSTVVLTWQPVAGAYYNVYRSEVPGGGSGAVYTALGSAGSPRFVDGSAQRGVTYYYVVTASGGGIESSSSNEASIRVP